MQKSTILCKFKFMICKDIKHCISDLQSKNISVDAIADKVDMNRKSVMLCINKYTEDGIENPITARIT